MTLANRFVTNNQLQGAASYMCGLIFIFCKIKFRAKSLHMHLAFRVHDCMVTRVSSTDGQPFHSHRLRIALVPFSFYPFYPCHTFFGSFRWLIYFTHVLVSVGRLLMLLLIHVLTVLVADSTPTHVHRRIVINTNDKLKIVYVIMITSRAMRDKSRKVSERELL